MPEFKTTMRYNPQTGKVEQTRVERKSTSSGWVKGNVSFLVEGEILKTLVGFAKEDGLDLSETVQRGKAVNVYVRAAIADFAKARQARQKQAAEEERAKAEAVAQAAAQAAAQANPAPAPAKVQSGNGKQAPQVRQPVAAAR